MKVCLLSNSDGRGGGYAAAYRLHRGLIKSGIDSTMLVGEKTSGDHTILSPMNKLSQVWAKLIPGVSYLPLLLYKRRELTPYSLQWLPDHLASKVARISPDIINLHWINAGFLQIETLAKFEQPIVWTLHDMWPFTGGCHYSGECDRYTDSCGACPQLGSDRKADISRWVWWRKARAWKNINLTLVTPSRWLADLAGRSSLFGDLRIEVIPNGLDIQHYRPLDRDMVRDLLGLPKDKRLILFGATSPTSDRRKGFYLLQDALQRLGEDVSWRDCLELVIFGASEPPDSPRFSLKTHYLGRLTDDISIALVYAAADVFVAPSLQDNLPNTVMEALACGTPCVAFKIGGMADMIEHRENGYLAHPYDIEDFVKGIAWVLEEPKNRLIACAREKVEREFALEIQAERYLQLYERILNRSNNFR
jgi:glycosyltransferase involved in cell wall biosynthesis